ncbi:hypothetical protein O9G_003190 [Rozella allomycis CSF55]|uniref:Uncharacterized protein n=1 Tax=Rozella allomycis (strain CSF55) TaxID=988480 RepID=A0A075AVG6_ROZAC|nr:hypothetical protein O9G_003190 [Rozella allomycis CSF55]|eukprot:EPZ34110.1 hypothetical protein O9G_003190 [Rozella allomycis CSF55]
MSNDRVPPADFLSPLLNCVQYILDNDKSSASTASYKASNVIKQIERYIESNAYLEMTKEELFERRDETERAVQKEIQETEAFIKNSLEGKGFVKMDLD